VIDGRTKNRLLQSYPMFAGVPADTMEDALSGAAVMHVPAGAVMFDENQPCQGFPLLLSGSIRVIKAAASGRELLLYRVCAGESCILTSSCLLGHTRYQARGVVEEEVELVALSPAAFRALISKCEPFRDYIFSLFSERLTDLMQLVSAVAFQKLDQRLAGLLLARHNPVHATHQALADELGCAREIVSRLLKHFAEAGMVRLAREQIEVVDAAALRSLSAP
jgi:CRP/FNR family transcriptional regulator